VYGQEIPGDADMEGGDVDMTAGGDDAAKVTPYPHPHPLDPCPRAKP
jgi:hypothetical protein